MDWSSWPRISTEPEDAVPRFQATCDELPPALPISGGVRKPASYSGAGVMPSLLVALVGADYHV